MDLQISSFRLQKAGNNFDECEDKAYPRALNKKHYTQKILNEDIFTLGLADGATDGMFSKEWADILVKAFCRSKESHTDFEHIIGKAEKNWELWIKNYITNRIKHDKPLKWYEEPGLKSGSNSTLLKLVLFDLKDSDGGKWEAHAIGDTCLFHIREGNLMQYFPINSSSEFNNYPPLIASNPIRNKNLLNSYKAFSGDWLAHDKFYLMTDALACWFLKGIEDNESPWLSYPFTVDEKKIEFEQWIYNLRFIEKIKNDDVTLINLEIMK